MKYQIAFIFLFLFLGNVFSQCDTNRYRTRLFTEVYKLEDVKYGEAPVWNIPYNNTDLLMDIYEPLNDFQTKRPLMIWIHPGGFLLGDKSADDMVALCDSFARKGYVTVSLGYRLGFNPLSNESAERAVYRSVQDVRAAIRYLYEYADVYDIDTNYTFVGGSSAGAVTSLHLAYLNQDEVPMSILGGAFSPALGDLDSTGNTYVHDIELTGIVGLWGALGDSLYIDSTENTPVLLIHGTNDGVVSFGVGEPFGAPTLDVLHGSRSIHNRLDELGIQHSFNPFEGLGHEFHGADNGAFNSPPNAYWDTILHLVDSHYLSLVLPNSSAIFGEPTLCVGDTAIYSLNIQDNETGCWNVIGGDILENWGDSISVIWNQNGSQQIISRVENEIGAVSSSEEFQVTVNMLPPQVNLSTSISNNTVSLIPDSLNYMYSWDFGDGNMSTVTSPMHTYATTGIYEISMIATDQNNCSSLTSELVYIEVVGMDDLNAQKYKVYPTVSKGVIHISNIDKPTSILLYDNIGRLVLSEGLTMGNNVIDAHYLSSGNYLGYLDINGELVMFRFIIR
ncbi:MAG: PKD domain-containing protein [Crocinitomicaceae bacterium]|nr:PKD domain-containing protein [Crocinitomicaceae bacterium]